MPEQISVKAKNQRYRRAMSLQQRIAREMAEARVGCDLRLLVDQPLIARSEADAPEVDARVVLSEPATVGEFIRRRITGSRGYDLLA
jgi:ribosomal protein S12 methylthiotransferase